MQPPILLTAQSRKLFRQLNALFGAAKAGWQRYLHRRRLRSTIRQLEGLSDFALKDIGLQRGEITSAVMRTEHASIAEQQAGACAAQDVENAGKRTQVQSRVRHEHRFIHRI